MAAAPIRPQVCAHILASLTVLLCANSCRHSRRVASIGGEVPADNAIVDPASAGAPSESDARLTDIGTTVAADLHRPIPAATGGYRRCDGLAPAEHHVRAVRRRPHPHAPCTGLGLASDRDILGNSARRPAKALEARMIEAVATSHIVGVPLSERVQRGTIGMAKAGTAGCSQREPCYEYPPPHRARSSAGQGIVAGYTGTSEADISHCSMSALPSLRYAQGAGLQWTPRREFCLQ